MHSDVTLVTGATGFAGSHVLDGLDRGARITGWCRPGGRRPNGRPQITWQDVDLTDRGRVVAAITELRPARIFHLAGAPNVAASWASAVPHLAVNALGTHHVLEAVRLAGEPCRVLVVSSGQIYHSSDEPIGEDAALGPSNPYGLSKLAQDQLALNVARDEQLEVVVARPFNHIGPGQQAGFAVSSFARQIARIERDLDPPTIRVGNLEARRDITDVRDVVRAYRLLMDKGVAGRAYNVCSGRSWRIRDLLDELLSLSPASIAIEVDAARFRPNDVPIVQGDCSRIRSELDWTPTIRVEQTLRDTLAWWRENTARP
jgi:GDP-4-dehydro-6-deoxy-D-mannose reductase